MAVYKKILLGGLVAVVSGLCMNSEAQAQVFIGPPLVGPRVVARAVLPPVPVVRPVLAAPVVATPIVRTYGYSSYSSYRPSYYSTPVVRPTVVAPVVRTAPVVVTTRLRPAYVPLQPVRNAIRFGLR